MSIWGATVITNLLSAIPYLGKDLVVSINNLVLPVIGIISPHAIKKEKYYDFYSIPSSFLEMLVGFIDGDGYISITKTTKGFITIKLVISLDLKDLITLECPVKPLLGAVFLRIPQKKPSPITLSG